MTTSFPHFSPPRNPRYVYSNLNRCALMTRDQFEAASDLYRYWNFTRDMIVAQTGLKPWEVEVVIDEVERQKQREKLEKRQLDIFRMPERRAAL